MKIQLAYKQQSVTDVEAESEVLRKRHREAENERQRLHQMFQDMLLKKRELEEEVENLRQSLIRSEADNSRSEGAELP